MSEPSQDARDDQQAPEEVHAVPMTEDEAWDAHYSFVLAKFGEDVSANWGWGVDYIAREIQTKLYLDPPLVVVTDMDTGESHVVPY